MDNTNIDVLVIGGVSLDVFLFIDSANLTHNSEKYFEFGTKVPVEYLHNDIGGGGANTAVGLSRHNLKVAFVSKIGNDDNAKFVLERLKNENVSVSLLKRGIMNTGQSIIVQSEKTDRTIFTYRGANCEISINDVPHDILQKTKYIFINSVYAESSNILLDIINNISIGNTKIALSLSISEIEYLGEKLFTIFKSIDYLIINEEESKYLYHTLTNNNHNKDERCQACNTKTNEILNFVSNLGVKNFGITLGSSGVKFIDDHKKIYSIPSKPADVINTTGLGDAFYSGFLAYIIKGKNIEDSIMHGIDNSISVMSFPGAQTGLLKED